MVVPRFGAHAPACGTHGGLLLWRGCGHTLFVGGCRMKAELEGMAAQKQTMVEAIAEKRKFLESLPVQLKAVEKVSMAITRHCQPCSIGLRTHCVLLPAV